MSLSAFEEAHECLAVAQAVFRELGDDLGLAADRRDLLPGTGVPGTVRRGQGGHGRRAAAVGERAGQPAHDAGAGQRAERSAWNSVQLGDLSEARAFCLKAIELCQAIGYSPGEAGTWDTLGVVLQSGSARTPRP